MADADLRTAAQAVLDEWNCRWKGDKNQLFRDLEAALAAEEKPKVERSGGFGHVIINGYVTIPGITPELYQGGMWWYERPIPEKPPEPSIEERLERAAEAEVCEPIDPLLREAAATIRELRQKK